MSERGLPPSVLELVSGGVIVVVARLQAALARVDVGARARPRVRGRLLVLIVQRGVLISVQRLLARRRGAPSVGSSLVLICIRRYCCWRGRVG